MMELEQVLDGTVVEIIIVTFQINQCTNNGAAMETTFFVHSATFFFEKFESSVS